MTDTPAFIEAHTEILDVTPTEVVTTQLQDIPDEFISDLKRNKIDADHERAGEFMLAASIPEVLHLQWLREGYDCTREPARKTVQRLQAQGLDAFIQTNKRI
jgi:hypothetical protein